MRSRIAFVATTALVVTAFSVAPAQADPPVAPTVENLTTAEGQVSADVLTDQPIVMATITGDFADAVPWDVNEGKASVVLDTWGFEAEDPPLAVAACETAEYAIATCSVPVENDYTPVDVTPTVTFSEDTSVGPGQAFDIQVADFGGGNLTARWDNIEGDVQSTVLAHESTTDLTGPDGTGLVSILRCNVDHPSFCSAPGGFTSPLTRRTTSTFTVDNVPTITGSQPTAGPAMQTPLRGIYDLEYHFEKVGGETVTGGTSTAAAIPSNGVIPAAIAVDRASLTDGDWDLVVSMTITDPAFDDEPLPASEVEVRFTVDTTGPVAMITGNRGTIHPRISGLPSYPNSVTATATGDTSGIADWVVRRATAEAGVFARTFSTGTSVTWNGKNDFGEVVGPGTFQIHTRDALGNLSASFATVVVTSKHVITGSFTREVKAGPTLVDKYVGRCSTLRRPALRGWVGSLGFYANTRCPNTSVNTSLVSTVHGLTVPAGYTYTYLRISAYGGAARSHVRSRAVLRYLTDTNRWRYEYLMHPTLGWQNAAVPASANAYVDSNNRLYWGVYTLSGHRYDVAKFKVQLKYRRVVD